MMKAKSENITMLTINHKPALYRNLSVAEARTKLVATLRWREMFKPEDTLKEEFPPDIFGQLGHVYGHDKDGRPVTYVDMHAWLILFYVYF